MNRDRRRSRLWFANRSALAAALAAGLLGGCVPDGRDGPRLSGSEPDRGEPPVPGFRGRGGPTPQLTGPAVSARIAPPPISGGTLLVLRDGKTAVAADPERESVFIADLGAERLHGTVSLQEGDEPGRLAEDGAGNVLVALRRGGALVSIDPRGPTLQRRVPVCPMPRGLAVDAGGNVHVACAGGELITLSPALEELRRVTLDRDLRDVVASGTHLFVSRFRSAEVLVVEGADLRLRERRMPPGSATANMPATRGTQSKGEVQAPPTRSADPAVAWRMRPTPNGGALMLHMEGSNDELGVQEGGYAGGGRCAGPIGAALAEFHADSAQVKTGPQIAASAAVDFDVSRDRRRVAILARAGQSGETGSPIVLSSLAGMGEANIGPCVPPPPPPDDQVIEYRPPAGEAIALAFDGDGRLVVQTREPARLEIVTHRGGSIKLSDDSRADTGHKVFHLPTASGLACLSCHPDAADDGRVWRFAELGRRRTQSLRGGIVNTAPFHWDGQMRDLGHLMAEVFTSRMQGPRLGGAEVNLLGGWMDKQPAFHAGAGADGDAVERGRALFNDAKVACASCHRGSALTDNSSRLVGTGEMLQVPSLRGVGLRAPFMHDGCAKTLLDRFTAPCGGGDQHGVTSHLDDHQLQDLVAYMESL